MLWIRIPGGLWAFFILSLVLSSPFALSQSYCNTNENPYCRGVKAFQALCCPYPSRCFYADRYGAVGCCPSGENCASAANQGPTTYSTVYPAGSVITLATTAAPPPTQQPTTQALSTIIETAQPPATTPTTVGGVIGTITSAVGGAGQTVTSAVGGAGQTITSAAGAVYSSVSGVLVGGAGGLETPTILAWTTCFATVVMLWMGG